MKFYDENWLINLNPRLFTKRSNLIKEEATTAGKNQSKINQLPESTYVREVKKQCFSEGPVEDILPTTTKDPMFKEVEKQWRN